MKCSSSVVRALILPAGALTTLCNPSASAQVAVSPQRMKVLGVVDPRFVSYNVEAVEVTGGRLGTVQVRGSNQVRGTNSCCRRLRQRFRRPACRSR